MRRRTTLLLVAGTIAGGCSRDAPITAPDLDPAEAMVVPPAAVAAKVKGSSTTVAIDDALGRLLPSLGDYGIPLRTPLLALQKRPGDAAAWDALRRAIAAIGATLPEKHQADLEALSLGLDAVAPR